MSGPKRVNTTAFTVFSEKKTSEGNETKPKNNLKEYSYSRQYLSMYSILSIYLKC